MRKRLVGIGFCVTGGSKNGSNVRGCGVKLFPVQMYANKCQTISAKFKIWPQIALLSH